MSPKNDGGNLRTSAQLWMSAYTKAADLGGSAAVCTLPVERRLRPGHRFRRLVTAYNGERCVRVPTEGLVPMGKKQKPSPR